MARLITSAIKLLDDGWKTPRAYSKAYAQVPHAPGVYMLECLDFSDNGFQSVGIAYIGQSKNLAKRLDGHWVFLQESHDFVRPWFKLVAASDLRTTERSLIQKYDPPFNIQGRHRGWRGFEHALV